MTRKANHTNPIYKEVYNELVKRIENNALDKLSAVSIGQEYNVNRNTADKIIRLLDTNGWVRRIPRKGTFPVKNNLKKINSINIIYSFDAFNRQFLNTYPYVNAKLIESIFRDELARRCNVNLLFIDPLYSYSQILEKFTSLGSRAGFVVLSPDESGNIINLLRQEQMPYMTFSYEHADFNAVTHDTGQSAYRAVEHLIKISGRKNILFLNVGRSISSNPWTAARFRGYVKALEDNNLPLRDELVFNTSGTVDSGIALMEHLKRHSEIDAVFSATFENGLALVNNIKLVGIKIPEDLAVIVFYDLPEFSVSSPAITAVKAPLEKMGHTIIKELLDMINFGFRDDIRHIFNDELILRDSC
ncbi:MAG: substrate-binding domain-containing protein [Victivallales bacterium]